MKFLFTLLVTALILSPGISQIIFQEDFDGVGGPTSGGAGTYSFPAGWLLANVDNGTPSSQVAYVNEAWERREDFGQNVSDSCAFSTSWYAPAGSADDWMWTPPIALLDNCVLSWNAKTYDPLYQDGYEVRIMVEPDVPTGATGVIGNMISASTLLFSIPAENSSWTNRTLDLSDYDGETVRIAFRNNSSDKFLLVIDDVIIQKSIEYNIELLSTSTYEYSQVPLDQEFPFPFSATVENSGTMDLSNIVLEVNVYDESNTVVHTTTSPAVEVLASSAMATLEATTSFVATTAGVYRFHYSLSMDESDEEPENDSTSTYGTVSDLVFARDDGEHDANLGIGSGQIGYLGQEFAFRSESAIGSVDIYTAGYGGGTHQVGMAIFRVTNGIPEETAIYTATPMIIPMGAEFQWFNFTIPGGLAVDAEDTLVVAAQEIDSTLQIGQSVDIFTPGTVWVDWPSNPFGNWVNAEQFGNQFAKTQMIRVNLFVGNCEDGILNGDEEGIDCGGSCSPCPPPDAVCGVITVYVNPGSPAYDGPGTNNIWLIPAEDLDAGSVSSYTSPDLDVRRYLSTLTFDWTTNGACIDIGPNGGSLSNADKGTVYRDCLPVRNADFNTWKMYQLRIQDPAGSDVCIGTVKVVPQIPALANGSVIHYALDDEIIFKNAASEEQDEAGSFYGSTLENVYVAPNPGSDHLFVHWVSSAQSKVSIMITDVSGAVVQLREIEALSGTNIVDFDMQSLSYGMYMIRIQTDKEAVVCKWIKS